MRIRIALFFIMSYSLISGCAVKTGPSVEYKLDAFHARMINEKHPPLSILVTDPQASAGYQTESMLYESKPYQLEAFANNAWAGRPAKMLLPLILQSLQYTGYFYAVTSSPYGEKADYRLDTHLLELQQNFLVKPSTIKLVVKVVLTHVADGRVIASQIINQCVPCPADTPYGGVIAANEATRKFTAVLTDFVIQHIKKDCAKT